MCIIYLRTILPYQSLQAMDISGYYHFLRRKIQLVVCFFCQIEILPKDYEKHCAKNHSINTKRTCVWCRQFSWPLGKKKKFVDHLLKCSKKSFRDASSTHNRLLNFNHAFQQKKIYNFCSSLPTVNEYEYLWPLEVDTPRVLFRDENLNYAAACVEKYLQLKDTHEWFHLMISSVAFETFVDALDRDGGITRTLLFSCWCDGGRYPEAKHRHHRHLIVASPTDHFLKNVWAKVKILSKEDKPYRNFPCKRVKRIESPLHLVNTMGYLSHRKSRCDFKFNDNSKKPYKMHHFYLYRTLPVDFRLPLVTLWENGIEQMLYREKFQNVSISYVVQNEMVFENERYKQKIKYLEKHERGLVLPVSKNHTPTSNKGSPHSLYLMNGKKLDFEICPENESMDDETWLQMQAEGGNCFYDNVEDELWTPRPRDQKILRLHKPVVDENKRLTAEINRLKKDLETSEAHWKSQLETERAQWERKSKTSKANSKRKRDQMKSEISKLKQENEIKQAKIMQLYEEANAGKFFYINNAKIN